MTQIFEKLSMNSLESREHVMLSESQVAVIAALSKQGKSIKAINRITGHSRSTIRRYLRPNENQERSSLGRPLSAEMAFLRDHEAEIRALFFDCQQRCSVVQRFLKKDYDQYISGRMLERFCKKFRREYIEANMPKIQRFETLPGAQMQIDFGELDVKVNGSMMRVHFFACILSYSRRIFAKAYPVENTETWLNGLESSFYYFGGRPEQVVSDNAAALVKKPYAHTESEKFTPRYLEFSKYHAFRISATAPRKPRSKGKIERAIRYIKENFFVNVEFDTLEELNKELLNWCQEISDNRVLGQSHITEGKTPKERWAIEKEKIQNRPIVMSKLYLEYHVHRKVDNKGFMRINNQLYRLPDRCISQEVEAFITDELIRVMLSGELVVTLHKAKDTYTVREQTSSTLYERNTAYEERLADLQQDEEWQKYQNVGSALFRDTTSYDAVFTSANSSAS